MGGRMSSRRFLVFCFSGKDYSEAWFVEEEFLIRTVKGELVFSCF